MLLRGVDGIFRYFVGGSDPPVFHVREAFVVSAGGGVREGNVCPPMLAEPTHFDGGLPLVPPPLSRAVEGVLGVLIESRTGGRVVPCIWCDPSREKGATPGKTVYVTPRDGTPASGGGVPIPGEEG